MQGQSEDIRIHAQEMQRGRRLMEEILARHTGQTVERIHEDLDRDFILDPEAAKAYGVVDHAGGRTATYPYPPPEP
jgi:ATP-dependent Clp protease protease subunit